MKIHRFGKKYGLLRYCESHLSSTIGDNLDFLLSNNSYLARNVLVFAQRSIFNYRVLKAIEASLSRQAQK